MHFSHSQHFHDFRSLSNFRWCSLQSSLSLQPLAHIEFHSLRDLTLDTRFDAHLESGVGHALLGKAVLDSIWAFQHHRQRDRETERERERERLSKKTTECMRSQQRKFMEVLMWQIHTNGGHLKHRLHRKPACFTKLRSVDEEQGLINFLIVYFWAMLDGASFVVLAWIRRIWKTETANALAQPEAEKLAHQGIVDPPSAISRTQIPVFFTGTARLQSGWLWPEIEVIIGAVDAHLQAVVFFESPWNIFA